MNPDVKKSTVGFKILKFFLSLIPTKGIPYQYRRYVGTDLKIQAKYLSEFSEVDSALQWESCMLSVPVKVNRWFIVSWKRRIVQPYIIESAPKRAIFVKVEAQGIFEPQLTYC